MSKVISELLWFCITSLSDWFKVLGPLFQPWPTRIDLFSLYILFSHFRPRDVTLGKTFFQMSSYARQYVRITYEKRKENSLENITWSEMGKQNVQAKRGLLKPKPIVARARTFSRALCRLRVIISNFDWFTGLSPSFLIGQSNYFGFGFTTPD